MKLLKVCLTVLMVLALTSCKNSSDDPASPEPAAKITGQTYTNTELGIQMTAPANWTLQQNVKVNGYDALLMGTYTKSTGFQPTFTVISTAISGQSDTETLITNAERTLHQMFSSVVIESKRGVAINGFQCAELVYSFMTNNVAIKQKMLTWPCSSSMLVTVTFNAQADQYNDISKDFDAIQNSLKKI